MIENNAPKPKKKLRHPVLFWTLMVALAFAAAAERTIVMQIERCENGLLDVCATQQDAYVQLVLDQINLKANRDDAEIINDILGTLDASSNKYWTFSRAQAMLFVKDVLETNKYKGFTASSYFASESARRFLDGLQLNRVTHGTIDMSGTQYVASGVMFRCNGEDYRLCLLTNRGVLLDNNAFLGAKVNLLTVLAFLLLLLILVPLIFAKHMRAMLFELDEKEDSIRELNLRMEQLNKRLAERDLHDTRFNLWREDAIGGFLDKLEARGVRDVSVIEVVCDTPAAQRRVLAGARCVLDRKVLRFALGAQDLLLLFVCVERDTALLSAMALQGEDARITRRYIAEDEGGFDAARVRERFGIGK